MELASTNPVRLGLALTMMAWQQSKHLYLGSSSSPFCCSCCCYAIHLAHGQLSHVLFPHEKLQPEISSSGPGSADSGHSRRASTSTTTANDGLPLPVCHRGPLQANGFSSSSQRLFGLSSSKTGSPRPNYFQIFPYFFPLMYKFIHLLVDVGALFSAASTMYCWPVA